MTLKRRLTASGLLALALLAATPVRAEVVQLVPTNKQVTPGQFGPVLQVFRQGRISEYSVARGEIDRASVVDRRRAIDWARATFGLDRTRDTVLYCPGGLIGVSCVDPMEFKRKPKP